MVACAEAYGNRRCVENGLRKRHSNFSTLFMVSGREFCSENSVFVLLEVCFERSGRIQAGKLLEVIEHASYSNRYCELALLFSGSSGT